MARSFSVAPALALFLFVAALTVALDAALPKPLGPVSDFAGLLTANVRAELTMLLRQTEQATTTEIAVVTVPSLEGMTVEDYAQRLFQEWGAGRRAADNG